MVDKNQDLFGQIDALLGKRSAAALSRPVGQEDDFPTLTDVVLPDSSEGKEKSDAPGSFIERRVTERRKTASLLTSPVTPNVYRNDLSQQEIVETIELRLNELFQQHQNRLDSVIREIIRDELRNIL